LTIGMTVDEALEAISVWGTLRRLPPGPGRPPELRVEKDGRDIFAFFEDGSTLTAVEIWRPVGGDVTVLWEDIDMFATPADDILRQFRDRGITVDDSDPERPFCPDMTIGLNRENGPGAAFDGIGRYIESVVVGHPATTRWTCPESNYPRYERSRWAGVQRSAAETVCGNAR
jgi:hypothetical protein